MSLASWRGQLAWNGREPLIRLPAGIDEALIAGPPHAAGARNIGPTIVSNQIINPGDDAIAVHGNYYTVSLLLCTPCCAPPAVSALSRQKAATSAHSVEAMQCDTQRQARWLSPFQSVSSLQTSGQRQYEWQETTVNLTYQPFRRGLLENELPVVLQVYAAEPATNSLIIFSKDCGVSARRPFMMIYTLDHLH